MIKLVKERVCHGVSLFGTGIKVERSRIVKREAAALGAFNTIPEV